MYDGEMDVWSAHEEVGRTIYIFIYSNTHVDKSPLLTKIQKAHNIKTSSNEKFKKINAERWIVD